MTDDSDDHFNLLDQPWIHCQMTDGTGAQELSLLEVFRRAPHVARVGGESPLQSVAVLRVLLVILWRAHWEHGDLGEASPRAWWLKQRSDLGTGALAEPVPEYLEEHRSRFNLLDPKAPFMQVADLQKKDGSFDSPARLVPEAESGYFTLRAGKALESLSLSEAARWLVTMHAFDYSGIKPGALGDSRVKGGRGYPIGPGWTGQTGQVVLHGANLEETLLLNTPAGALRRAFEENEDLPVWERGLVTAAPRHEEASMPTGPCDLLTWQTRRIRLHVEGGAVVGVLVSNGDKPENKNQLQDPMTAYRYSEPQSKKAKRTVYMPQAHDEELPLWRGVGPLLTREGIDGNTPSGIPPTTVQWFQELRADGDVGQTQPVTVELLGAVYGAQQSSFANTISTSLPATWDMLTEQEPRLSAAAISAARVALQAAVPLGRFAGGLLQAAGGEYAFQPSARADLLHQLQHNYERWLRALTSTADVPSMERKWQTSVRAAALAQAKHLLDSASPQVHIGRYTGDDGSRLVSAATLWNQLLGQLNKELPLSAPSSDKPAADTPESERQ